MRIADISCSNLIIFVEDGSDSYSEAGDDEISLQELYYSFVLLF